MANQALEEVTIQLAQLLLEEGLFQRSQESQDLESRLQEAGKDALPYWRALLENDLEACRVAAAFNLLILAREEDLGAAAIGALTRRALEDDSSRVRKQALAAVLEARGGSAARLVEAVAEDLDPEVAQYAREALEKLEPSDDASAVADLIDYDLDERIASFLMTGIDPESVPTGFLSEETVTQKLRREATSFAARIASEPDALSLVNRRALALFITRDSDGQVKQDAVRALEVLLPEEPEPIVQRIRARGFLNRSDVEVLEITGTLTKAEELGEASVLVSVVVQRVTGAVFVR